MRKRSTLASLSVAVALLCSSLRGQAVWLATPGNFAGLLVSASPGDVLLLSPSATPYPSMPLLKGLTIFGQDQLVGHAQINVPSGEIAHVVGIRFEDTFVTVTGAGMTQFDDCTFEGTGPSTPLALTSTNVIMQDCTVSHASMFQAASALQAMKMSNSTVVMRDCSVTGSPAGITFQGSALPLVRPSSRAMTVGGGTLHAQDSAITGGHVAIFNWVYEGPKPAIFSTGTEFILSSCQVHGGFDPNGAAPSIEGAGQIQAARSVFIPAPLLPTQTAAPLIELRLQPDFVRGATSTLTVEGVPNGLFGVWLALTGPVTLAQVVAPLWIPIAAGSAPVAGVLDANGFAHVQVAVPNTPALIRARVMCQAVGGASLPLHASVLVGGFIN